MNTYSSADNEFQDQIASRFGASIIQPDTAAYFTEPRGRLSGAGVVVRPRNTDEVSGLMAMAHEARVPVIPYGGGTGLVGGQLTQAVTPLVVSLERMEAVRDVDPASAVMEVEAGVTLNAAQDVADQAGLLFPLSLASGGSARIGGVLATNAGGVGVLRYGSARALCLGVEAVLADGRIYRGLSALRKDNTGYDLRDVLVGSEGTLGIITAATLIMAPKPADSAAAIVAVPSVQAALDLLSLARDHVGEAVSAFELISRQSLDFMLETDVPVKAPFADLPEWMALIDLGMATGAQAALERVFEAAVVANIATDGIIATSDTQRRQMWHMREHIPEANRRVGSVASHDISLPISRIPDFVRKGAETVARFGDLRVNCFGHVGDGNLHYNVFPPKGQTRDQVAVPPADISRAIHDLVIDMGGSFSAEHGVGRTKVADLERYGDPVKLQMMRAIKTALDPRGILNPGAVLRG